MAIAKVLKIINAEVCPRTGSVFEGVQACGNSPAIGRVGAEPGGLIGRFIELEREQCRMELSGLEMQLADVTTLPRFIEAERFQPEAKIFIDLSRVF